MHQTDHEKESNYAGKTASIGTYLVTCKGLWGSETDRITLRRSGGLFDSPWVGDTSSIRPLCGFSPGPVRYSTISRNGLT